MADDSHRIYSIIHHVLDVTKRLSPSMFNGTIGLHRLVNSTIEEEPYDTEFVGSGVAVLYGDAAYVITADHVVRDCGGADQVCIQQNQANGTPEALSFGGQYVYTTSDLNLDIGRYELETILCESRSIVPIAISENDDDYFYPGGSYYVLGGFPASSIKKMSKHGPHKVNFRTIIALESDEEIADYPKSHHVILKYDRKSQARYRDGEKGTRIGVLPAGMSGCGIHRVSLLPNSEGNHVARLIGILTDYDRRRRLLIGTKIGPLIRSGFFKET